MRRCQVIFQGNQTKEKLRNALSARGNFRLDLTWRMGTISKGFARIVKVTHFAQAINFRKRARGNCTRGHLNNEGGVELHEIKQSRDKTEISKEII